jgi:hypothetical protein
LFKHTGDINALDDAIEIESRAIEAWDKLVESAGDFYHENLMMGRASANLTGHWRDELPKLTAGLEKLLEQSRRFKPDVTEGKITIAHVPVRKALPGKRLSIRATVGAREPADKVRLGYRNGQGDYKWVDMKRNKPYVYFASIRAKDVTAGLNYVIEASLRSKHAKTGPIAVAVTADNKAPEVSHEHISEAPAGEPLTVTAHVDDASGVKWVRLRYRSVTQFQDYKTLEMTATGDSEYKAVVPAKDIDPEWDFMYLFEVMDDNGNGAIYPDMEKETPYIVVKLDR